MGYEMQASNIYSESLQVRMHHVGTLVSDIERYLDNSLWNLMTPIIYDPIQKARLCLVCIAEDRSHLVELIEPMGQDSPVQLAFTKGQKLHHLCFETQDCQGADEIIRKYRFLKVTDWQPAVLFQQRLVRFVYTPHHELVEFLASE